MQKLRNFFQRPDRKVTLDLVTSALVFALALFGFNVDPENSAYIGKIAGFLVAYLVPNKSK